MIEGLGEIQIPASGARLQPYWDGARAGRLLLPRCRNCGNIHWYPRAVCPFCLSDEIEWQEASGKGRIFSFSIMRSSKEPYVIAYVTLEEGITVMTNIVECALNRLAIGLDVCVKFATHGVAPVPVFMPISRYR